MNKSNMRFLSSLLVGGVITTTNVMAAPSVRMLGTNSARVGTNAAVVKSDTNTAATQRLGSIRPKTVSTVTPVTVNKVVSKANTVATEPSADDEARLSLGKYIHATGVTTGSIKPATTTSTPSASSSEFVDLADRVSDLESQAVLSAGDGLTVENNTIALSDDISSLPEQVSALQTNVANNYYTMDGVETYVQNYVNEVVEGGNNVTYTSTSGDNTYEAIQIADTFDEEGFSFTD